MKFANLWLGVKSDQRSRPLYQWALLAILMVSSNIPTHAEIEEVVVTAQKRQQNAQDIGLSVDAFSDENTKFLVNDIGALAGQSPGVESYGNGTYLQSYFIRGIGLNEFSGNFNAPVAIHNDEVYVSKNWQAARPNFDIGRVEILKGPQGTVFGRNTTGGAVNFYTNEPTREFEAYVNAGADEHERYRLEGAISGPLSERLSGRFSFYSGFGNGGPQDNIFDGSEHGTPDVQQFRGQLLWDLEATTVKVLVHGGTDESDLLAYKGPGIFNATAPGFCPEALSGDVSLSPGTCAKFNGIAALNGQPELEVEPDDVFTINQDRPGEKDDSFYGGYVRVEHEFGNLVFTSLTSYDRYERDQFEDSDSSPVASNNLDFFNELDEFTQELRISGALLEEKFNFILGAFYQRDDLIQVDSLDLSENPFNLPPANAGLPPRLTGVFDQTVDSFALFFNSDYAITDRLILTTGLRYTREETPIDDAETNAGLNDVVGDEDLPQTLFVPGGIDSLNSATSALNPSNDGITDNERVDTNVSWRLGLSYDFSDNVLGYINTTTGFRTGGFSIPFGGTIVEFEDEEVLSVEVGVKTQLLNDRIQFNAAVFRTRTDDAQVNVDDPVSPVVPITRNVPEITTLGFEAGLKFAATDYLSGNLSISYLDSEITDSGGALVTTIALAPVAIEDNAPVNTPDWQVGGGLNYFKPLGATSGRLSVITGFDFRWVDDRPLEITNAPADFVDDYVVVNARIGLGETEGRWEVILFANNLFDEEYLTYTNNLPGPGFKLDIFGETRTVGLNARYSF